MIRRAGKTSAPAPVKWGEGGAATKKRHFQPPVDGSEIMTIFGLQPSREVGVLKQAIKDAILDGVIPNEREAAMEFLLSQAAGLGLSPV